MKSIIISISVMLVSLGAVILSSVYVSTTLGRLEEDAKNVEIDEANVEAAAEKYEKLLKIYEKNQPFLLLLLPDRALYEIEGAFSDAINYTKAGEYPSALTAKGRLHAAIERMRTLSELTLKSVF